MAAMGRAEIHRSPRTFPGTTHVPPCQWPSAAADPRHEECPAMDQLATSARPDPFGARATLTTSLGTTVAYYRLATLVEQGLAELDRLPFTVRVLLENALRNAGGEFVDAA